MNDILIIDPIGKLTVVEDKERADAWFVVLQSMRDKIIQPDPLKRTGTIVKRVLEEDDLEKQKLAEARLDGSSA